MEGLAIGDWQVIPALNELRRAGASRRIQPQQMELLMRLAREPGEVIERQVLIDEVWARDVVNDEVLSRAVAELRQALGDDARKPQFIETIPKRGYRLIATVGSMSSAGNSALPAGLRWMLVMVLAAIAVAAVMIFTLPEADAPQGFRDIATQASALTGEAGIERAPAVSRDGLQVAFLRQVRLGESVEVGVVDVSSAAVRSVAITDLTPYRVRWRPTDEGPLVTLSGERDGRCVIVAPQADGQWLEVAACGNVAQFDWSADGDWLYYVPYTDTGGGAIARKNLTTGDFEELTFSAVPTQADAHPRLSPDGQQLAFSRGDLTISEVWLLDIGGTHGPRQLTHDGQLVTGLAWRDDGTLIYSSDRDGVQAIRSLSVSDGRVTALGARDGRGLDVGGGRIVWERPRYEANIWRIDLEGGADEQQVVSSNRYDNHPAVSADGQHLAFISNRSDRVALWLSGADGSAPRKLIELPEARLSRPSWHPHEPQLLFSVFDQRGSRLMRTDLDGNAEVIPASEAVLEAVWMMDGEHILAVRQEDRKPGLWRLDGSDQAQRLGSFTPSRVMVDGQDRIWFSYLGAPGLFRLATDTLRPEAVIPTLPEWAWNDWSVRGERLAFADDNGLWVSDLDGNNRVRVSERIPTPVGLTLGLTASGQSLFVAHTDGVEIDLVSALLDADPIR